MGTNIPKTTLLEIFTCRHNLLNKYEELFLAYICVQFEQIMLIRPQYFHLIEVLSR